MAVGSSDLNIVVKLVDQASKELQNLTKEFDKIWDSISTQTQQAQNFTSKMWGVSVSIQKDGQNISRVVSENKDGFVALWVWAWVAFAWITYWIGQATEAAIKYQNAFVWLQSVAEWTGQDFAKAKVFVDEFTKDGLVPTEDAALSLKNLFARGFNLEESIVLMNRFKDSAAFGRQSQLQLWEAIVGATEWLKNENSMLVDNAWVTKNVAKMWEDYAKERGLVTTQLTLDQKREAEYLGIIEETKFQVWDAAKYSDTYSWALARQDAASNKLTGTIWTLLQPTLLQITTAFTDILTPITNFANEHPKLTSNIIIATAAITWLVAWLVAIWFAIWPITAAITAVGALLSVLTGPIGLIIGAIAALTLAYTTNFWGFADFVNWIVARLMPLFQTIIDGVIDIYNQVSEYFWRISEPIMAFVNFVLPYIQEFLSNFVSYFENLLSSLVVILQGAWQIIQGVFTLAFALIWGAFEIFINLITWNWAWVWEGMKNLVSWAWEGIKLIITWAANIISWFVWIWLNNLKLIFSSVWTWIKLLVSWIWKWMTTFISNNLNFFDTIITAWLWLINKSWVNAWEGFKWVLSGVWDGIKQTVAAGINWVIDKINALIIAANSVSSKVGVNLPTIPPLKFEKGGIVPKFETWGIIPGGKNPANHDQTMVAVDPWELILNRAQQVNLAGQLSGETKKTTILQLNISGNSFYWDDNSFIEKIGNTLVEKFQSHYSLQSF